MNKQGGLALLLLFGVGAFVVSRQAAAHGIDAPDNGGDWFSLDSLLPLSDNTYTDTGELSDMNGPANAGAMSDAGVQRLVLTESFSATPYPDPAGQTKTYSIYYGHQIQPGETFNGSREEGETYLRQDIAKAENAIHNYVFVPLSQNQFDALVSFIYNVGVSAFAKSSLVKKLNTGDYQGAADEMLRWTKANGHDSQSLVARRNEERMTFLS